MSINMTVISSALVAGVILLVTSCATKSSVAECRYPPGILAYWKLDEGEGNTARDSVNGNDGIIDGASWVPGQVGTALSFDGTDDRVRIPSQVISGTTMTLNLWVKTNDDRFGLISGANHEFDNEYVLYIALSPEEIKRHYSQALEGMSYCER